MGSEPRIAVIGGGFIGQLVQYAVPSARVLDWRKTPPKDHMETRNLGPQYLWEPIPGVPSHSFPVTTLVDGEPPTPDTILAYKRKIGKADDGGDWGLQFQHQTIGWESTLPVPRIEYGKTVKMISLPEKTLGMADWSTVEYDLLVSTIPLPAFLDMLIVGPEYQNGFRSNPIYISTTPKIHEQTQPEPRMVLNYLSNPDDPHYRITSVVAGQVSVEYAESLVSIPGEVATILKPGKIHPHKESQLICSMLATYDCFCFGRFATWAPDELAHQTWKSIVEWKELKGL
jgi:hypothetical protein